MKKNTRNDKNIKNEHYSFCLIHITPRQLSTPNLQLEYVKKIISYNLTVCQMLHLLRKYDIACFACIDAMFTILRRKTNIIKTPLPIDKMLFYCERTRKQCVTYFKFSLNMN